MRYLKQEKKKSKLPVIIGILVACLAAAGAGAWFFFDWPTEKSTVVEEQADYVKIQTPYGDILLEETWAPYLRYEINRGDVTEVHFAAEIAETSVKLFDLYLGSEEELAGYLTAGSGEKVPVGVVVHDIVPADSWTQEEEELAFSMQDAVNEVLTQLKVETEPLDVQEEPETVGAEVSVETDFGVLTYTDYWNGGLRIAEEDSRIGGFGTVPGKPEQKLFEVSVGGDGEISAGIYTDENGQQIPVFLTVPELTLDADWTEEQQRTLYAMQNVLNDILDQLELTSAEQPKETESVLEDVTVTTTYGALTYPGQYAGKLRIAQDTSSGYRIRAYATMPGKAERHLFDIVIGARGDVYAGVLTDPYGNRKDVYLNVGDWEPDDSWSEEERREIALMQNLLNDFCEQLAVSEEEEKAENHGTGTAANGDVMIWTAYGTLQYPGEYRQKLVTEITGENGNTVRFYVVRSTGQRIRLFELIFGGTGDAYVGQYTAKDGTVYEVYITSDEITPDDSWSDEELGTICGMQEAANYVLDKMEESGILVY